MALADSFARFQDRVQQISQANQPFDLGAMRQVLAGGNVGQSLGFNTTRDVLGLTPETLRSSIEMGIAQQAARNKSIGDALALREAMTGNKEIRDAMYRGAEAEMRLAGESELLGQRGEQATSLEKLRQEFEGTQRELERTMHMDVAKLGADTQKQIAAARNKLLLKQIESMDKYRTTLADNQHAKINTQVATNINNSIQRIKTSPKYKAGDREKDIFDLSLARAFVDNTPDQTSVKAPTNMIGSTKLTKTVKTTDKNGKPMIVNEDATELFKLTDPSTNISGWYYKSPSLARETGGKQVLRPYMIDPTRHAPTGADLFGRTNTNIYSGIGSPKVNLTDNTIDFGD